MTLTENFKPKTYISFLPNFIIWWKWRQKMKKKIRNFFETCVILAIVLAFVMPGAATIIKPSLLEETLGISDAEFEWVPVDSSGSHTILGNEIILYETGQLVTLEIHISGWYPNLLKAVQATVDSAGYSNGVGGTLYPLGWPGTPLDGCFINTSRPDYVFYGMVQVDAVYTGDLNYIWGATLLVGSKTDSGQTYYLGTLILEIPTDASGTYTIEFLPDDDKTFMQDDVGQKILPLTLTPALITINEPPNKPVKPSGQTNGKTGTSYTYSSTTTDPNGDQLYYWFDWGDSTNSSWVGPYTSGSPGNASHTWAAQGSYNIQVKAKDIYDVESDWSDPLTVSMPKNKAYNLNFNLLSLLFERFPNAFPIINHLLDLFNFKM